MSKRKISPKIEKYKEDLKSYNYAFIEKNLALRRLLLSFLNLLIAVIGIALSEPKYESMPKDDNMVFSALFLFLLSMFKIYFDCREFLFGNYKLGYIIKGDPYSTFVNTEEQSKIGVMSHFCDGLRSIFESMSTLFLYWIGVIWVAIFSYYNLDKKVILFAIGVIIFNIIFYSSYIDKCKTKEQELAKEEIDTILHNMED